jgi:hypothetical protein
MKLVTDEFDDETLMRIIRKFIIHIYGKQLTMKENSSGYIRFYSVGPEPPYHRNLSGRLWIDDDRLYNIIKTWFSCDATVALSLIAFYFSTYYDIKVTDAKMQSHVFFDGSVDYSEFDDPNHNDDEEVITENIFNKLINKLKRKEPEVELDPDKRKGLKKLLRKFLEYQLANLSVGEHQFVAEGYFLNGEFLMGWSGDFLMISSDFEDMIKEQFSDLSRSDIGEITLEWYRKKYNKPNVDRVSWMGGNKISRSRGRGRAL